MTRTKQKSRFEVVEWPEEWSDTENRETHTEICFTGSWGACKAFMSGVEWSQRDATLRLRRKKNNR